MLVNRTDIIDYLIVFTGLFINVFNKRFFEIDKQKLVEKGGVVMKIVNPFGRSTSRDSISPLGCYCSSGSQNMRFDVGSCYLCGCQCDSGTTNRNSNNAVAHAKQSV